MRIAVLADVHGNLLALEAVVRDLRAQSPDLVLNLGDHLSGPLWAAGTADLLMTQTSWVQIRGNHDRQLIEFQPSAMGKSDRAAHDQISAPQKAWLGSLPATSSVENEIFLCHGTPLQDDEYLVEEVSHGFARIAHPNEIRARLGQRQGLILCGHSHLCQMVQLDDETMVINPGSVGLAAYDDDQHRFPHVMEAGSPHARYLILDRVDGRWRPTFHALEYDWEAAAQLAERGQRFEWAHALRTGYFRESR